MNLQDYIRDVPDFPKPGIVFKDITPLLRSRQALAHSIEQLAAPFQARGITQVAAIESRGFIFGSCVARAIDCGFVPIRKAGKLPWRCVRSEYELEYGSDVLEIHDDALGREDRVLLIDDVLATGGTALAASELVRSFGAELTSVAVVIELDFLGGRKRMGDTPVHSILHY